MKLNNLFKYLGKSNLNLQLFFQEIRERNLIVISRALFILSIRVKNAYSLKVQCHLKT